MNVHQKIVRDNAGTILTSSLKFEWFYNWFIIRKL